MKVRSIVFSNFIWRFAERCGAQAVQFVVSVILARILIPEDFGIIALMNVFITILNVFVNYGLGVALIQKKNADDIDFSTVFYTNILFCLLLYWLLFILAPLIAGFYQNPEMTMFVRVSGLTLIVSGVKNIQSAYVSRHMMFKRFFFATLGGTIGAAVIGILMAIAGFGAWALIIQSLFNNAVDTIILWWTVKWRPKKCFSFERLKGLLSYGWRMLASSLLDTVYNNVRTLIIGKLYSSADLAYYNKGKAWPNLFIENINSSIDSVLLPAMAKEQEYSERVKNITRRAIKTSSYVMAPFVMGLAFVAEPLTRLVLTEKWLPCVPYMRIFCITYMFYPIHTANLNAIKAMGRSDLFLKLEVIKKVVGLVAIIFTMHFGVLAMAYSLIFTSIVSQIINSWPNRKLLNYGYIEQVKDILPGIVLAVFMGCFVSLVALVHLPDVVTLIIQVPLGASIYIGLSKLFRLDSFEYLWEIIKPVILRSTEVRRKSNDYRKEDC